MKRLILLIIFVTFITFTKNGLESSYGGTVIGSQEVKYFIFEDSGKFKLAELDDKSGYTYREVNPTKENPLSITQVSGEQGQTLWKLSISTSQKPLEKPLEICGYKLPKGSQVIINFYTDGTTEIVSKQSTLTLERGSTDKITLGENDSIKFNKNCYFEVKGAQ